MFERITITNLISLPSACARCGEPLCQTCGPVPSLGDQIRELLAPLPAASAGDAAGLRGELEAPALLADAAATSVPDAEAAIAEAQLAYDAALDRLHALPPRATVAQIQAAEDLLRSADRALSERLAARADADRRARRSEPGARDATR